MSWTKIYLSKHCEKKHILVNAVKKTYLNKTPWKKNLFYENSVKKTLFLEAP